MVLTFGSVNEILKCDQVKAAEHYIPVVMFVILHKAVLTFGSVDEILKCDQVKATGQCFFVVLFTIIKGAVSR